MDRRLVGLLSLSCLTPACGRDGGHDPATGDALSAVPVRVADAGEVLGDLYGGIYPPSIHLAAGPNGGLLALWTEASPDEVRAARFDPARGWEPPETLATGVFVGPGGVTLDSTGRGLAVWTECCPWLTWARRHERARGWAAPERVQPTPSSVLGNRGRGISFLGVTLVGQPTGEAFALWNQRDLGSPFCSPTCPPPALAAARFTPEGGWEPPRIAISDEVYNGNHSAVVDSEGRVVVAFAGQGSSGIGVVRYLGSQGWGPPESLAAYPANGPRIAAGLSGRLALLWRNAYQRYEGLTLVDPTIDGSLFDTGTGWSNPTDVIDADVRIHLAFDAAGTGTLVWVQGGALMSRTLARNEGWGPVEAVANVNAQDAALLVEPGGDVSVVLWSGPELLLVRRARNGNWSAPRPLAISTASEHTVPSLIADSRGNGFAAWADVQDRNVSIWALGFRTTGP